MRLIIAFLISVASLASSTAQDFYFEIYFEDAVGDKDTIVLGIDREATIGIDEAFGEVNIIDMPWKAGLDVRVADDYYQLVRGGSTSYHTKSQIIPRRFEVLNIIMRSDHFPITASWDNQILRPVDSIAGSILTSIHPGGWFDTGSPSDLGVVELGKRSSVTFTSNLEGSFNDNYAHILNDTVPTYWFTFAPTDFIVSSTQLEKGIDRQFHLYPNPSHSTMQLENNSGKSISELRLYDEQGRFILSATSNSLIDLSTCHHGKYFLQILTEEGAFYWKKVVKY